MTQTTYERILALLDRVYGRPAEYDRRLAGLVYAAARRARPYAEAVRAGWQDGRLDGEYLSRG